MTQCAYSKLKLKVLQDTVSTTFNGEEILVKQYLPIQQKIEMVERIVNMSLQENRFANPILIDLLSGVFIIQYYTNLKFKQEKLDNPKELYDEIKSSGLLALISNIIGAEEVQWVKDNAVKIAKEFHAYNNSVLGLMDLITENYNNIGGDVNDLFQKISNPENLGLLKDVLTKLG